MRLHSLVDLTGNVNMIEKLVLGGTGTRDTDPQPLRHQVTLNFKAASESIFDQKI